MTAAFKTTTTDATRTDLWWRNNASATNIAALTLDERKPGQLGMPGSFRPAISSKLIERAPSDVVAIALNHAVRSVPGSGVSFRPPGPTLADGALRLPWRTLDVQRCCTRYAGRARSPASQARNRRGGATGGALAGGGADDSSS